MLVDAAPRVGGQYWRHRAGDDGSPAPRLAGLRGPARRPSDTAVAAGHARPPRRRPGVARHARGRTGSSIHAPGRRPGPRGPGADRRPRDRRVRPPAAVPGLDAARRLHRRRRAGAAQGARRRGGHADRRGRDRAVPAAGRDRAGRGGRDGRRRVRGRAADRVRPPPADGAAERLEAARGRGLPAGAARTPRARTAPGSTVIEAHGRRRGDRRARRAAGRRLAHRPGLGAGARVRRGRGRATGSRPSRSSRSSSAASTSSTPTAASSPRVDDDQASTVAGVFVAGEATGVGGADLSLAEGEIAGFAAAASALRPGRRSGRDTTGAPPAGPRPRVRHGPPGGVPGAARLARLADAGDDRLPLRGGDRGPGRRGDDRPRRDGRPDRQAARPAGHGPVPGPRLRLRDGVPRRGPGRTGGHRGGRRRPRRPPDRAAGPARRARGRRRRRTDPLRPTLSTM